MQESQGVIFLKKKKKRKKKTHQNPSVKNHPLALTSKKKKREKGKKNLRRWLIAMGASASAALWIGSMDRRDTLDCRCDSGRSRRWPVSAVLAINLFTVDSLLGWLGFLLSDNHWTSLLLQMILGPHSYNHQELTLGQGCFLTPVFRVAVPSFMPLPR